MKVTCHSCQNEFSDRLKTCPSCGTSRAISNDINKTPIRRSDSFHLNNDGTQSNRRMCESEGCPLIGSTSFNTGPAGPWWCTIHTNLNHLDHRVVTARILANKKDIFEKLERIYEFSRMSMAKYDFQEPNRIWNQIFDICSRDRQPGEEG